MRLLATLTMLPACGFSVGGGVGGGSDAGNAPRPEASIGDGAIDAMTDAMIDAVPSSCTAGGTVDTFSGSTPCSSWATYDETQSTVTQTGGKLRIAPSSSSPVTHGGCFATGLSAFGPSGLFISVESVAAGLSSYTALTAYVASGTPSAIVMRNGTISVVNPATLVAAGSWPYVAATMKWWRLRPVATGIVGEVSANALTWTPIGTITGPVPTQIRIDISAGNSAEEQNAGEAVFDNLDVCP